MTRMANLLSSSGKRRWLIHCSTSRRLRDISNLLGENHQKEEKNMKLVKEVQNFGGRFINSEIKSMIFIFNF